MKAEKSSLQPTWFLLAILFSLFIAAGDVLAHDLGLTRLKITQPPDKSVDNSLENKLIVEAKLPVKLEPSTPIVNNGCSVTRLSQVNLSRLNKLLTWQVNCPDSLATPDSIVFDWDRAAALIIATNRAGNSVERLVDAENGLIEIDLSQYLGKEPDQVSLAWEYIKLGIEHILIGLDHLAFVLGLFLIARGWKLVKLVTAFTVGHSISLAASSQGLLSIPVPPTEAVIALSVAFVYREAILPENKHSQSIVLVVLFGLLHGLGFASVLSELGVSSDSVFLSILSFNIGVEIGQLIFITFVFITAAALERIQLFKPEMARSLVAVPLGSLAIFWTIDRVAVLV